MKTDTLQEKLVKLRILWYGQELWLNKIGVPLTELDMKMANK